jgi:hypothetical protein
MPPTEAKKGLQPHEVEVIRRWIAAGAVTARPEPESIGAGPYFTEEERTFWSFQPVHRPEVPSTPGGFDVRNPIDAFLGVQLRDKGLPFSPEADRPTLIRRATYDLLGLPPTPEEVAAFVTDAAPDAYERLIERLLASPRYGERWGRHWLDVAGYSETDGNVGRDRGRPHACKYRDYVIRSFNADKPYDRFVLEQLAGDELARRPFDPNDPATVELLTATGFLRMAPDLTETSNTLPERNQAVAETFKVVTSSLLGLTVGCAQCHDHRYDPIAQEDYYRLRAVFDPAFDLGQWKRPSQRLFDITTAKAKVEGERIEAVAREKEADLKRRAEALARTILERELARVPDGERAAVTQAVGVSRGRRTAEQTALLKKYPRVQDVPFIAGFLV